MLRVFAKSELMGFVAVLYSRLMLYTRLALPVAVCIAKRGRNTRLAWIANPNPNPTNPIV